MRSNAHLICYGDASLCQVSALMDLYLATNGPGWLSNANWLSGDPCSNSWAGISCPSGLITKMCVRLLCPDIDGALTGSECAIGIVFWRPIASTERYQPPLQTLPIFNSCTHIRDDAFSLHNTFSDRVDCSVGRYLGNNALQGTITTAIGSLTNLQYLYEIYHKDSDNAAHSGSCLVRTST